MMGGGRREGGVEREQFIPVYSFTCLFTVVIECSVTLVGFTRHMRTHQCRRESLHERERERWGGWMEGGSVGRARERERERVS